MGDKQLAELKAVIASTQALLSHLSASLKDAQSSPPSLSSDGVPNALELASKAAALIKAQTTKLGLLVLNKPLAPLAISAILKTLGSECLPVLVATVQVAGAQPGTSTLAAAGRYPRCVAADMARHAATLLREFDSFLQQLAQIVSAARGEDAGAALASTGIIWAACEALVKLEDDGAVVDCAVRAADTAHAQVKDAIEELTEWMEHEEGEDGGDDDDDDDGDYDSDGGSSAKDSNDIFGVSSGCPAELRPVADRALRLVEHVRMLYPPLIKRRIKRFAPPLTAKTKMEDLPPASTVRRLDEVLGELKKFGENIDDVAGFLYEGERDKAEQQMESLASSARICAGSMHKNWEDKEDELTAWLVGKWEPLLTEVMGNVKKLG